MDTWLNHNWDFLITHFVKTRISCKLTQLNLMSVNRREDQKGKEDYNLVSNAWDFILHKLKHIRYKLTDLINYLIIKSHILNHMFGLFTVIIYYFLHVEKVPYTSKYTCQLQVNNTYIWTERKCLGWT